MKSIIFLTLILLFSVGQTSNSQTNESNAAAQEVRKLERAWLDAYEQHDAKAMNAIVADDFTITFPDGARQTKPQIMDSIKQVRNPANNLKFSTEDVQARVYGDTVILTGRVVTEYQRDGKPVKEQSLYTDTYVRRDGRWQVVASHLSNVAQSQNLNSSVSSNSGQGRSLSETLILTNVTVIDGNGGRPKPNMTLVVSDGRISDMYASGRKKSPAGATVMDLSGHYVIPGLIDSHYHFIPRTKEESEARRRFAFVGGITTVREMAGDARVSAQLAKEGNDGAVKSPRVYYTALMAGPSWFTDERVNQVLSPGLAPGTAAWAQAIKPDTDIVQAVADAKATGATGIKLYADLSPDTVVKLTRESHRQGLKVWSHATIFPSKPSDAVAAGVNVISHSLDLVFELDEKLPETLSQASYRKVNWQSVSIEAPRITALLQRMRKRGTMLDDTIIHTALRVIPDIVTTQAEKPESERTPGFAIGVENWTFGITGRAHKLGILLVAGTDFQEQPRRQDFPNIHTELELLVTKCGLTPIEAITTATRNGAIALGIQNSYGTIAKGKVADLVILSSDPSTDIRNTTKILYVIKGGKLHKREKVIMPAP